MNLERMHRVEWVMGMVAWSAIAAAIAAAGCTNADTASASTSLQQQNAASAGAAGGAPAPQGAPVPPPSAADPPGPPSCPFSFVGPTTISPPGQSCSTTPSNRGSKIAVDAAGNIYAAFACNGRIEVVTSTNFGLTFGPPTTVRSGTSLYALAAGPAGVAYVATFDAQGLVVQTSTDAGASFGAEVVVDPASTAADISLATIGDTLYVGSDGPSGLQVFRNGARAGGPFTAASTNIPDAGTFDVLVDHTNGNVWAAAASATGAIQFAESTNGAVSFAPPFAPPGQLVESDFAFGGGRIFGSGSSQGTIQFFSWFDPTVSTATAVAGPSNFIPTTVSGSTRSVAVDSTGVGYLAETEQVGPGQVDVLFVNPDHTNVKEDALFPPGNFANLTALPAPCMGFLLEDTAPDGTVSLIVGELSRLGIISPPPPPNP
jgi:hypothetical protein